MDDRKFIPCTIVCPYAILCSECAVNEITAKAVNEALDKIMDYCVSERKDTRDAKYPSQDYERGMIIMSNRIHTFVGSLYNHD